MKTFYPIAIILITGFLTSSFDLKKNEFTKDQNSYNFYFDFVKGTDPVADSEVANDFFRRYSDLKKYRSDVMSLYKNRSLGTIWYDEGEIN
jgi:hypothetical protein